jgi:hypothetical protein
MRRHRFAKFLVVVVLCVLGVGFARGWFSVSKSPDTEGNKININVTVDPEKVKEDADQVKELPNKLKQGADEGASP